MPEFLIDPEIARLEEHRQAEGTASMVQTGIDAGEGAGHKVEAIAGGFMCYAGKGSWANQAAGLGLTGPVSDADLDRLVEFYASRGVEPRIEVAACVDESLLKGLGARGFMVLEFENVLVKALSDLDEVEPSLTYAPPTNLTIESVDRTDPDAVLEFALVSTCGFRPVDEPIPEPFLQSARNMMRQDRCHGFVARIDGRAVGGATMDASAHVASMCGTSVEEAYRRRGIQTALIMKRLEFARELGCQYATIHSRPGIPTERNALRVGFAMAYAKATMVMPGARLERSP